MRVGLLHHRTLTKAQITLLYVDQQYPIDVVVNEIQFKIALYESILLDWIQEHSNNLDTTEVSINSVIDDHVATHVTVYHGS